MGRFCCCRCCYCCWWCRCHRFGNSFFFSFILATVYHITNRKINAHIQKCLQLDFCAWFPFLRLPRTYQLHTHSLSYAHTASAKVNYGAANEFKVEQRNWTFFERAERSEWTWYVFIRRGRGEGDGGGDAAEKSAYRYANRLPVKVCIHTVYSQHPAGSTLRSSHQRTPFIIDITAICLPMILSANACSRAFLQYLMCAPVSTCN